MSRSAHLDAVRGFAVLLVLGYHLSYRVVPAPGDVIARFVRVIGWLGVDLFFALSGFLVVLILSQPDARADLATFVKKRGLRILPIYFIAIAIFAVSDWVFFNGDTLMLLPLTAMFLTGWVIPYFGIDAVPFTITWSLSVEVTAYILFAFIARVHWSLMRLFLIGLALGVPLLRVWLAFGLGWSEAVIGVFPPARLDALALGGLAALGAFAPLIRMRRAALVWGLVTVAAIVGIRFAVWVPNLVPTLGFSFFGLCAALWVAALAQADRSKPNILPNGLVTASASIGLVSYFIYLYHLFVIEGALLLGLGSLGFWGAFVVTTAMTYGLARLSWAWIEAPLIRRAGAASRTGLAP